MSSKLSGFKRRCAGYVEKAEAHKGETIRLLFAPGSTFEGGTFVNCAMDLSTLTNSHFKEMTLSGCDLIGASFRGATLENVTFGRCRLIGASFEGARLRNVGFSDSLMEGTSFVGATLHAQVSFVDCDLTAADLRFYESDADQPNFVRSDLRQAVFAVNCEFWNATFDDKATADFGRVYARASRNPELIAAVKAKWGADEYDKVDRYMRRER